MLLINKYEPKTVEDVFFHKTKYDFLKKLANDNSVPHIIFYGCPGSGVKTAIRLFLQLLYGPDVNKINDSIYKVSGSGSTITEVSVKQSNYHIAIDPNNNNFDRYIIQYVIKEYAMKMSFNLINHKKSFKTIQINNIDDLPYYAQTSLRRTLELFSDSCRFVMYCRSLSKVIEPLRSRCLLIRLDAPSNEEIFKYIYTISLKENMMLDLDQYSYIVRNAKRNIQKALWLCQFFSEKINPVSDYDILIKKLSYIITDSNYTEMSEIRDYMYHILITNIPCSNILKDITATLVNNKKLPEIIKSQIINNAAIYDFNLVRARRPIIHLDVFILSIIELINNYKINKKKVLLIK